MTSNTYITRGKTAHFALGHPSSLPSNQLPLEIDVFNYYKLLRESEKNKPVLEVSKQIAAELIEFWREKGNIPTYDMFWVSQKVSFVIKKGNDLLKIPLKRRQGASSENKDNNGATTSRGRNKKELPNLNKLLDICPCSHSERYLCDCSADVKVPEREFTFLQDQRGERKMCISSIDQVTTQCWEERREREEKRMKYEEAEREKLTNQFDFMRESEDALLAESEDKDTDFIDVELEDSNRKAPRITKQNRLNIPKFVAELDRYNVSDSAGAALATSLLEDLNMITTEDKSLVFDKFKIRRARQLNRNTKKTNLEEGNQGRIKCIGTDGKRDKDTKCLIEREVNNNIVRVQELKTEEHIAYTDPDKYLTHSVIEEGKGTGKSLGKDLVEVVRDFQSENCLECVVCDGTAVNTGCYGGLIATAEAELNRELQWSICQLHGNECPMRHVFQYLDGGHGTSGPSSFKGPMGKSYTSENSYAEDPVNFDPIKSPNLPDLPDSVISDLSRDQQLLFRYSKAVDEGIVDPQLAKQKPGGINHARWLTLALTALIDYTRDESPSKEKEKFIDYLQKVYIPVWFSIKMNPLIKDGARNCFSCLKFLKSQPIEVQEVARKSVQTNAYFAHSSNLLLSMLSDHDEEVRQKAVNTIISIRNGDTQVEKTSQGIRVFRIPKLNWDADKYTEMIDWDISFMTEPPIVKHMTIEVLMNAYAKPLDIPKYPNHS